MRWIDKTGNALVFSSVHGSICPDCGYPKSQCRCKQIQSERSLPSDGIVRVRRETKGHGGKTVTAISGLPISEGEARKLMGELKRFCGSGGAIKEGIVYLQGDHCAKVIDELTRRGFKVKRAGG